MVRVDTGQIKMRQVVNFGNVRRSRKNKKIDQGTPKNKHKFDLGKKITSHAGEDQKI